jgi:hypothetical protein
LYEGEWYHYGDNFVTRAVSKGKTFIVLQGYMVDTGTEEDTFDIIPTSMKELKLQ